MRPPIELLAGEQVLTKTRKHWIVLVRDTAGTVAAGLAPFLLWALAAVFGLIPSGAAAYAFPLAFVSVLWLLIAWIALAVLWTDYYLDMWVVTDLRICNIEQVGLFNRKVASWNMDRVQAVSVSTANFLQTLLHYGTIEIQTAGPSDEYAEMEGVPYPENVRTLILRQIGQFEQLAGANKKQEELLHFVSHEVKGHLAKNKAAFASIVEGDYGSVPRKLRKVAHRALADTQQGVETVMDILDTSDLQTGSMHFESKPFNLKASLLGSVAGFQAAAKAKNLRLECSAPEGEVTVQGDEAKFRQHVVRNLIDNAIRYTPHGSVRVTLEKTPAGVRLSVKDSGVGIAPEDKERLFLEGGKGEHATNVNPESTGYGLFVAKTVVEAHGGTIRAESEGEGKGAEFIVELSAR